MIAVVSTDPNDPNDPSTPNIPAVPDGNKCSAEFKEHPVILVSMDGFRADYLFRGLTPNLLKLSKTGVSTPYMKPSYPTITFPNHYTIVTVCLIYFLFIYAYNFYQCLIQLNLIANLGEFM